jgi:hypothetical protein
MSQALEPFSYIRSKKLRNILDSEDPDLDLLSDIEITEQAAPNAILWELRARLWILIDKREEDLQKWGKAEPLLADEIRKGICSRQQFEKIIANPMKSAFLSRPLGSPEDRQEDLVRAAQARLWEILSLPIVGKDGRPDKSLAKIVFDTAKMVMERKYGTAIQRTETLAHVRNEQVGSPQPISVEALEADIRALNDRTQHAGSTSQTEEEGGAGA